MPWRSKTTLSAFCSHHCDYFSAKACITTVVINYILLVLFLKNHFALIIQNVLSFNFLKPPSLFIRMGPCKSQPFLFWRDLFFLALNWYLTFAQCLFSWSRMKATWNTPPLKSHFSVSLIPPQMFMQSLLYSPACPCFPLDTFLSKPSLSLNICLGVYFNHYTD